ncbi:MAG: thermonuclease family protein [Nanoarchaeota archaeon]
MKKPNTKEKIKTIILVIACIIALIILLTIAITLLQQSDEQEQTTFSENKVVTVMDGDTFQIASGEIIRLICVDAPELGEEGAEDATEALLSLIYNKEVRLESDVDDKDAYGRLLRYVYVNDSEEEIFVNKEMVKNNHAELFPYGNSIAKCDEIAG